jgi:hypothetical protein
VLIFHPFPGRKSDESSESMLSFSWLTAYWRQERECEPR